MKKSVLIIHPRLLTTGGANALAAWVLEALKTECQVSVFIREGVDFDGLNRLYGTSLKPGDFQIHRFSSSWSRLLRKLPIQGEMLQIALVLRAYRRLDRMHRFEVVMSTSNELDFGRKGIQYIHYPWASWPRPADELRWYHNQWSVRIYKGLFSVLSGASLRKIRQNVTLCNSRYIADIVRKTHRSQPIVVYPPVPGGFPDIRWADRQNAIVAIGRIAPEKRWALAVDIVRRIRESGIDMRFTLIGTTQHPEAEAEIRALAEQHSGWFTLRIAIPRAELVRLVTQHRYGIHTMENEHFGIAPAELQRGGCILFVHRSGGPMEIAGNEERQMFSNAEEGAAKIIEVARSPALQSELRIAGAERSRLFTSEAFVQRIRNLIRDFTPEP